jgi:hypothetical protein
MIKFEVVFSLLGELFAFLYFVPAFNTSTVTYVDKKEH